MLKHYVYSDRKHRYGLHVCEFCGQDYMTRIRTRKHDNCGCTPVRVTHGHERNRRPTPELKAYRKMRERCYNPQCKDYPNYGGRGITVDERWCAFEAFYRDMGPKPGPQFSIERVDVNAGYTPENCKWATKEEQANNTRNTRRITIDGTTRSLSAWLRELKVSKSSFYRRVHKGMTDVEALTHE